MSGLVSFKLKMTELQAYVAVAMAAEYRCSLPLCDKFLFYQVPDTNFVF